MATALPAQASVTMASKVCYNTVACHIQLSSPAHCPNHSGYRIRLRAQADYNFGADYNGRVITTVYKDFGASSVQTSLNKAYADLDDTMIYYNTNYTQSDRIQISYQYTSVPAKIKLWLECFN